MKPHEAAQVLATAAVLDNRLKPASEADAQLVARAWAGGLAYDMPIPFACTAVTKHYAESERVVTISALNLAWKIHKRRQREALELKALTSGACDDPIPDYLAAKTQLTRKASA